MTKLLHRSLTLTLAAWASFASVSAAHAATDTLTIVHINDTHSCLAQSGPRGYSLAGTRGGIARAATIVGLTRQTDPNVIFLHGGDFMIGDLFFNATFGVAELRMLQSLGLDAIALGNHEFDLGPQVLGMVLDSLAATGSNTSVISTNLIIPNDLSDLKNHVIQSTIKQYGSTKVGFFALTTPETNLLSQPGPAALDTNIGMIAATTVQELRAAGADVVICISHLGYENDRDLAAHVPGMTAIISAHSHQAVTATPVADPMGDTTWIEQAGAFYSHVGKMQFVVTGGKARLIDAHLIPLDESVPEEPTIKAVVDGLISDIESVYGPVYTQKIGEATEDLDEQPSSLLTKGDHDTPVGNLVADAERAAFNTDIAIVPGGSTAQPIWHGPLVSDDIYRTISYGFNTDNGLDYHLATFEISGQALVGGLEFGLAAIEQDDEFLSQVSGMTYSYDPAKPPYQRLQSATIGDAPLDPAKTYTVTSNEFVVAVMGALGIPISNVHIYSHDTTEFQTVTSYVASMGAISPAQEGRVNATNGLSVGSASAASMRLAVYPNPAQVRASLSYSLAAGQLAAIRIFDLKGNEVRAQKFGTTDSGIVALDLATLPAGRYILRLECGGRMQATAFLVQ